MVLRGIHISELQTSQDDCQNFRQQNGFFQPIPEIQKIKPISPELFRKIAPYLTVDDK